MARKPVKAKAEYERERRRARDRIKYAEKKGYKTAELPPPVRRNATYKEYKQAARELRQVQREQARYTKKKEKPEKPEQPDIIPEFYELYCSKFLELLNRIPKYKAKETHGRDIIIGWFNSLISREGHKRAAELIANAARAGMILEDALYYEPRTQAWISEAIKYLGIEISIEDMEDMTYQE